jgi:hypothetical protein
MLPVPALLDVRLAEFPVLFRIIDAREKALALLLLGQMQEELENASAVVVEVPLQPADRSIALVPEGFVVLGARYAFRAQNFRMHAHDQHLLVIRAVEDSDLAALRKGEGGSPQKIVLDLGRRSGA